MPCFLPPLQATAFYMSLGADLKNVLAFIFWLAGLAMVSGWGWLTTKFTAGECATKELAVETKGAIKELSGKTEHIIKELSGKTEHIGQDVAGIKQDVVGLTKEVVGLADLIRNERKDTKMEVVGLADLVRSERAENKTDVAGLADLIEPYLTCHQERPRGK